MFAESLKQTDTIKGTLYGYFNNVSNLFKKEEESEFMENSNEKVLYKMEKFYQLGSIGRTSIFEFPNKLRFIFLSNNECSGLEV